MDDAHLSWADHLLSRCAVRSGTDRSGGGWKMSKLYLVSAEKPENMIMQYDFLQEIIPCGKCRMYDGKNHTCKERNKNEIYTRNDFCSWGVRK